MKVGRRPKPESNHEDGKEEAWVLKQKPQASECHQNCEIKCGSGKQASVSCLGSNCITDYLTAVTACLPRVAAGRKVSFWLTV